MGSFKKINVVRYTWQNLPFQLFLSEWFNGTKYSHDVAQPSPLFISVLGTFTSSQTETPYPLNNNSLFPLPQPLVTTVLLSVFMPILGTSYKWNHTIFVFLSDLFHLSYCFKGSSRCIMCLNSCSFLRLNNIPLYVHITFWFSFHLLMDIWVAFSF